jgi:putative ABC transport system substrate-binding protein
MKEEGFGDIQWLVEDASGKKEKAEEAIRKLQAAGVDAYVAVGTNSAVPLAKAVQDKPIIITVVFDPVKAGIAKDWNASGRNLTGSSSYVSLASFLQRLCRYFSGDYAIRKVAVPYTPGEKNSEIQLAEVKSVEKALKLDVEAVPVANAQDVSKWLKNLRGHADLIMMTGGNVVAANSKEIIEASIHEKVLTATHLEDLAAQGILLGLVPDLDRMGRLAGKKLAAVLRGADPATIPIEAPPPKLVINEKTAAAGHFFLPKEIRVWAGGSVD